MGLFRPDRERRGHDPFLYVKMGMFVAGAVIAMVGIALDTSWLVNAGIVVLVLGFLLRLIPRRMG
jgi:hypothetical protein